MGRVGSQVISAAVATSRSTAIISAGSPHGVIRAVSVVAGKELAGVALLRGGTGGGDVARAFALVRVGGGERFGLSERVRGGIQALLANDVEESAGWVGGEYCHHVGILSSLRALAN